MSDLTPELQLKAELLNLQEQITSAHPQFPSLLRAIHTQLLKDPALVQTLTEEEIGIIATGLMKQTQITITTAAVKKPALTKKRVSNMSVDEL